MSIRFRKPMPLVAAAFACSLGGIAVMKVKAADPPPPAAVTIFVNKSMSGASLAAARAWLLVLAALPVSAQQLAVRRDVARGVELDRPAIPAVVLVGDRRVVGHVDRRRALELDVAAHRYFSGSIPTSSGSTASTTARDCSPRLSRSQVLARSGSSSSCPWRSEMILT